MVERLAPALGLAADAGVYSVEFFYVLDDLSLISCSGIAKSSHVSSCATVGRPLVDPLLQPRQGLSNLVRISSDLQIDQRGINAITGHLILLYTYRPRLFSRHSRESLPLRGVC